MANKTSKYRQNCIRKVAMQNGGRNNLVSKMNELQREGSQEPVNNGKWSGCLSYRWRNI